MGKQSNEFQKVIHLIHRQLAGTASVTESKYLRNRVTGEEREVDVAIESIAAGASLIVSVECVDYRGRKNGKGRAGSQWVEMMHGKHGSLQTNKLILVSAAGFTNPALQTAQFY